MRNHGSSGKLLNLNDSETCFTVAAVQIANEITSKTSRHVKRLQSKCFVDLLSYVRPKIMWNSFNRVCTLQKYIDSSDCAAQNSQKSVIMKTSCLDYSILPKTNGFKNFSV